LSVLPKQLKNRKRPLIVLFVDFRPAFVVRCLRITGNHQISTNIQILKGIRYHFRPRDVLQQLQLLRSGIPAIYQKLL